MNGLRDAVLPALQPPTFANSTASILAPPDLQAQHVTVQVTPLITVEKLILVVPVLNAFANCRTLTLSVIPV